MTKLSKDESTKRAAIIKTAIEAGELLRESVTETFGFDADNKPVLLSELNAKLEEAGEKPYDGKTAEAKTHRYVAKGMKGVMALYAGSSDVLVKRTNAAQASAATNRMKLSFAVDTDKAFENACENLAKAKRITIDEAHKILGPAFGK